MLPVNRTANIIFEVCLFYNAACLKHAHLDWVLLYTQETSKDLSCCKKSWLRRYGTRRDWWKNGHVTHHVTYNEGAISYLCVMSVKFRFSYVLFAKVRPINHFLQVKKDTWIWRSWNLLTITAPWRKLKSCYFNGLELLMNTKPHLVNGCRLPNFAIKAAKCNITLVGRLNKHRKLSKNLKLSFYQ